jgi:hypothetical protein
MEHFGREMFLERCRLLADGIVVVAWGGSIWSFQTGVLFMLENTHLYVSEYFCVRSLL